MKTSEFKDIEYQKDENGIVTVKFNTPKRKNALSIYSFYELHLAIEELENDSTAHAMIITGAQDPSSDNPAQQAYSSGGYFSPDALDGVGPEVLEKLDLSDIAQKRITLKMFDCEKPIIAAINGLAIGGAVTLTLAGADQVYMSDTAWMQLPFAKLGISAELASSYLLPRLLGLQAAKEVMFYADKIDAQKALKLGLTNEVVPHAELMTFVHQKVLKLIPPEGAGLAIREMKKLMHAPLRNEMAEALDRENATLHKLFTSSDFAEGVSARIEKRAAVYIGR